MNYYHCFDANIDCGDGDYGTKLFIAKWGGQAFNGTNPDLLLSNVVIPIEEC